MCLVEPVLSAVVGSCCRRVRFELDVFWKILPDVLHDEQLSSSTLDDLLKVLLPSGTSPNIVNVEMTNNIACMEIDVLNL